MQHELGAGELLDSAGRLIEAGWAPREVRRYDRSRIRAGAWGIKEWDYYCILTDRFALALTVADNGYLGFLGTSWMDLVARTAINHGAVRALPLGRMNAWQWDRVELPAGEAALSFWLSPQAGGGPVRLLMVQGNGEASIWRASASTAASVPHLPSAGPGCLCCRSRPRRQTSRSTAQRSPGPARWQQCQTGA